tara:strand:+ start:3899 stop:4819 length:921 start_codon:yes stop_codon:yes gene_type:complete
MSPVAIFTYNRPDHLRQCIKSLKKNLLFKKTKFFIFQDGLKSYDGSISAKYEVLFSELPGNFKIIKRKKNYGLKRNIISGVSQILSRYKTAIICEDDLVFHKDFIYYMNSMLKKYDKHKNISSISGFSYAFKNQISHFPNEYLLSLTSSWGWATWGVYWNKFRKSNLSLKKKELFKNRKMQYNFDYDGSQSHTLWLKKNSLNKISSWNIEWEFFNFANSYLTLYPKRTLVENTGFDGSGTHCLKTSYQFQNISNKYRFKKNNKFFLYDPKESPRIRKIISKNIDEGIVKKFLKKIFYFNLLNRVTW